MKLTRLRCPNCGADFENVDVNENQKIFTCTRMGCGASFVLDQGVKFADIKKAEAEKIRQYRNEMAEAFNPFDRVLAGQNAEHILSILPDDFRAKVVMAISQCSFEDKRPMEVILSSRLEAAPEEFEEVFPALLAHSNHKVWKILMKVLPVYIRDPQKLSEMQRAADVRLEGIKKEIEYFAVVPRDIFVCHSSVDNEVVMRVLTELEADGSKCWISERNMPPDTRYYWEKIEEMIHMCKIFLVCCSDNAMMSDAVQKELTMASKAPVKRLELKLDDRKHTTQFAHFFDGINWVRLTGDFQASVAKLKESVYQLKYEEDPAETNVTVTGEEFSHRLEAEKLRWLAEEKPGWLNQEMDRWLEEEKQGWLEQEMDRWLAEEKPGWLEQEMTRWLEEEKPGWLEQEMTRWLEGEKPIWLNKEMNRWLAEEKPGWLSREINRWLTEMKPRWIEVEKKRWLSETDQKSGTETAETETRVDPPALPELAVGQTVAMGRYKQGTGSQCNAEPIEWQVLSVENDRALLVSRYLLDAKPYHNSKQRVNWEWCSLRSWLNNEFSHFSFLPEERNRLGSEVFILSKKEVEKYLSMEPEKLQCTATGFAKEKGAAVNEKNGFSWWWLRKDDTANAVGCAVDTYGVYWENFSGIDNVSGSVRPAFWLDLEKQ